MGGRQFCSLNYINIDLFPQFSTKRVNVIFHFIDSVDHHGNVSFEAQSLQPYGLRPFFLAIYLRLTHIVTSGFLGLTGGLGWCWAKFEENKARKICCFMVLRRTSPGNIEGADDTDLCVIQDSQKLRK